MSGMKPTTISSLIVALLFSTGAVVLADAKDDVTAAIKNLSDAPDYAWTQSVEGGMGASGEGKIQTDGTTYLSMTFRDNTVEIYFQGDKGAVKTDDGWQSLDDAGNAGGRTPGTMAARFVKNFRAPAALAENLAKSAPELKKNDDGSYSGDLSDEEANRFLRMGRRRGGAAASQPTNVKGTVTFWVTDNMLTKFQWHVSGSIGDRDIDRTSTIELKDIGRTKIDVPAEAKAKWEPAATTEPAANG